MNMRFVGQVAVVTGAGAGIGREISRRLALEGASVLLNDIDEERAEQAAAAICEEGGQCRAAGGDTAEVDLVRRLPEQAVDTFGRIDIVVANAGITRFVDFLDYSPEEFDRIMSVNLGGSFFLAQSGARLMSRQGEGGRILLLSSVVGRQAVPQFSAYSMTKAALRMLARSLVVELSRYRITVNAIAPGATLTQRTLGDDPDYEATWSELTPLSRPASPEDVANAALFLLSTDAGHITGQTLTVDGGWSVTSPLADADREE